MKSNFSKSAILTIPPNKKIPLEQFKKKLLVQKHSLYLQKIFDARLQSASICELEPEILNENIKTIVYSICEINGLKKPENEICENRIVGDVKDFLIEYGYSEYNLSEIKLAFVLNCVSEFRYSSGDYIEKIKSKSEYFSLTFFVEVIERYSYLRMILDNQLISIFNGY